MGLRWTCVRSFCLSRQPSAYVARKDPTSPSLLATRNLRTAIERVRSDLVLEESQSPAFGGYQEIRNLYQRSSVFKADNSEERNIHIGLDLWINETASVHAALGGTIHSFQNNTALGDYGPTIIIQHELEGIIFHTLYGHLGEESLKGKLVGDTVAQGEQIGNLGLPPINGDYAPHLHFQIILDMENKVGDYPGVCSSTRLNHYTTNCPDPNLLLKIN